MSPATVTVVVRALAQELLALRGADKVAAQRAAARAARAEAARRCGLESAEFAQAPDGRPLPSDGWHWSVSHGGGLVAAALHRAPVGVDVEHIAARRADVVARVLDPSESAHLPEGPRGFIRAWTAKEAVLKATQLGLSGLGRCRVVGTFTPDQGACAGFAEGRLVALDGVTWRVAQHEHGGHVIAVTTADGACGTLALG